jgi:hypothetical protein
MLTVSLGFDSILEADGGMSTSVDGGKEEGFTPMIVLQL